MRQWLTGFSEVAPALNFGGIGAMTVALVYLIIKTAPRWRELGIGQRAGDLNHMGKRIEDLESKMERMAAEYAAETGLLRHKLANRTQCLESLLMLLRNGTIDVPKAIEQIEAMHTRMVAEEREETALLRAGRIDFAQSRGDGE